MTKQQIANAGYAGAHLTASRAKPLLDSLDFKGVVSMVRMVRTHPKLGMVRWVRLDSTLWRVRRIMMVVNGRNYATVSDAAKEFGVSAKTVRQYIVRGIIPAPPQVQNGLRRVSVFPPEYMARAKKAVADRLNQG